jgi:DNA-binding SARP family transcriptional activator
MSEEGYDERLAFLKALDSGIKSLPELRKIYPQAYHWNKQFEIVSFGTSEKLVFKAEETVLLCLLSS